MAEDVSILKKQIRSIQGKVEEQARELGDQDQSFAETSQKLMNLLREYEGMLEKK